MRTFDFSPLLRSTVGFDRISRLMDAAMQADEASAGYPPYNIEKLGENDYRITMAIAGFGPDDVEITAEQNTLTVKGRAKPDEENSVFLHRGIAGRAFERRFQLADHIRVHSAGMADGLLRIELVREIPEALKPRTIEIRTEQPHRAEQLTAKAA
jgi:molecular chaperone IbpA